MADQFTDAVRIHKESMVSGFKWENIEDVFAKCTEELAEVKEALAEGNADNLREEIGDFMLMSITLCNYLGLDAHDAIEGASTKLAKRVALTEKYLEKEGMSLTSATLKEKFVAWDAAKIEEKVQGL